MQVLYDEDVASHIAPEPCVVSREGQGEASAGDRAGWPSSRERAKSRTPTVLRNRKATRPAASSRAAEPVPAWSETPACMDAPCSGNREISLPTGGVAHRRPRALGRLYGQSQR